MTNVKKEAKKLLADNIRSKVRLTLVISKSVISKYPHKSNNIIVSIFLYISAQFLLAHTTGIL